MKKLSLVSIFALTFFLLAYSAYAQTLDDFLNSLAAIFNQPSITGYATSANCNSLCPSGSCSKSTSVSAGGWPVVVDCSGCSWCAQTTTTTTPTTTTTSSTTTTTTTIPITECCTTGPDSPPCQPDSQPCNTSITIQFSPGWNMFSLPIIPNSQIQNNCNHIRSIWHYNSTQSQYVRIENLNQVQSGLGYWINVQSSCTITLSGNPIFINDFPQLNSGWNQIGSTTQSTTFSPGNCNLISGPLWYDSAQHIYVNSNDIEPGKGYWIEVSDSCSLSYQTSTTTTFPACTDSDGGINYLENGTTIGSDGLSGNVITRTDECIDSNYVKEYSCYSSGGYSYVTYDNYSCSNLGKICSNGTCVSRTTTNQKDITKYSSKTAFLISDIDWHSVLSLVPIAVWTNDDGSIAKYPLLIYHSEGNAFDADSIIYFMQQYKPDKVVVVGNTPNELDNLLIVAPELGAGLKNDQILRIFPENYKSYWSSAGSVVVVDYNNYADGLMASVFASYINAPVLFVNSDNLNSYKNLLNAKVYVIDNLDSSVSDYISSNAKEVVSYSLSDLQKEYVMLTNTDKMILVNPNDLNIKYLASSNIYNGIFTPEKSSKSINELYSENSLASPILASAKHEVILSTKSTDYQDVDKSFIEQYKNLYNVFPMVYKCNLGDSCSNGFTSQKINLNKTDNEATFSFTIKEADLYYNSTKKYDFFSIMLNGFVYGCDQGIVGLELYLNGNLAESQSVSCSSLSDDIIFYDGLLLMSLSFWDLGPKYFSPGNLSVKIKLNDTAHLTAEYVEIYGWVGNPYSEARGNIVGKCKISESCGSGFSPLIVDDMGTYGDQNVTFMLNDVKKTDYFFSFKISGVYIQTANVYVNGNYLGNTSWIGSWADTKIFKLPLESISPSTQITIEPIPYQYEGMTGWMKVTNLQLKSIMPPKYYLTIFASPNSIQMTKLKSADYYTFREELDNRYYGNLIKGFGTDLLVGRIFGITISDASAYVARDLFIDIISKNKAALLMILEDPWACPDYCPDYSLTKDPATLRKYTQTFFTPEVQSQFEKISSYYGYDEVRSNQNMLQDYKNSQLIAYDDHGGPEGIYFLYSWNLKNNYLLPSTFFATACSTCEFDNEYMQKGDLFCMQNIRRGMLIYHGAVSVSVWHNYWEIFFRESFLEGKTIGEVFRDAKNHDYTFDLYYLIIGDPTLKARWW